MFGALGQVAFEIDGVNPTALRESRGRRKVKHPVLNRYPLIEDTGETERYIDLSIVISAEFSGTPYEDYLELVDMKNNNEVATLVIGKEIIGKFTIENINADTQYYPNGEVVLVKANIKLLEVK